MDTKAVFDSEVYKAVPHLSTKVLLLELTSLDEAPWSDLRGKALSERGSAHRLIRSQQIRTRETTLKGYKREAFFDAWKRYSPSPARTGETSETNETPEQNQGGNVSSDPTRVSDEAKRVSDRVPCASEDVSSACARTPTKTNDVAHVSHVSLVGRRQAHDQHKCQQCNAHDGTEGSYTVDGRTVWLHAECVPFWPAADGKGRH
jgi:hypothetical protein